MNREATATSDTSSSTAGYIRLTYHENSAMRGYEKKRARMVQDLGDTILKLVCDRATRPNSGPSG